MRELGRSMKQFDDTDHIPAHLIDTHSSLQSVPAGKLVVVTFENRRLIGLTCLVPDKNGNRSAVVVVYGWIPGVALLDDSFQGQSIAVVDRALQVVIGEIMQTVRPGTHPGFVYLSNPTPTAQLLLPAFARGVTDEGPGEHRFWISMEGSFFPRVSISQCLGRARVALRL